jgi:hypothetical protein
MTEETVGWDPAEFIRQQPALLELAVRNTPLGEREQHLRRYLRDEVLGGYDRRFLGYDGDLRRRMVAATREVLDAWLTDEIRARLPVGHRMRAFCIQHDLVDELERLVRDEVEGRREGAVVVGGRIYAVYPYLRGVPRQDADITGEVGVDHRLTAVSWSGDRLRIRGYAAIERVATKDDTVELLLRAGSAEHQVHTDPHQDGFEAVVDPAALEPGRWDVHVSVSALGLTMEARLGQIRSPALKTTPREKPHATAHFPEPGHLAIDIHPTPKKTRHPFPRVIMHLLRRPK